MNGYSFFYTTAIILAVVLVQIFLFFLSDEWLINDKALGVSFIGLFVWLMGITVLLEYIIQLITKLAKRPIGIIEVETTDREKDVVITAKGSNQKTMEENDG